MEQTYKDTIKSILKGIAIAMILTVVLMLIFSIVLAYTNVGENTITPVIIIVTGISILVGSSIGNMKIKKNGMLNGGIVGRTLYSDTILNFKFFKLEIWTKCTEYNNDCNRNSIRNTWWNYWS